MITLFVAERLPFVEYLRTINIPSFVMNVGRCNIVYKYSSLTDSIVSNEMYTKYLSRVIFISEIYLFD